MGMKNALEAALNNVAPDGQSWEVGYEEFWYQLRENDATMWEAFNAAMILANGNRRLPEPWYKSTRGKFYRLHRESTRQSEHEDQPEAGDEEAAPTE